MTPQRVARLQQQLEHLSGTETNHENYRLSAGGFLAEIDRMNLEVREYLRLHPSEVGAGAPGAGSGGSRGMPGLPLEEGLRMQAHPGIVFRSGPAGRRPGLVGGADVWEVVRVFLGVGAAREDRLEETAHLSGLTLQQVQAAVGYYADYRDEIDAWVRRVDEGAERAEATWGRTQQMLRA